jgi:conjugative transfer signal peptidase TraF
MNSLTPLIVANLGLAILAAAPAFQDHPPFIINETVSMAKGVYVYTDNASAIKRKDIVALKMTIGANAYLVDELGYPKRTLLIKRVAGLSGDVICRHGMRVTVNAQTVNAQSKDRFGNLLPVWDGCAVLLPNQVFLLGDHPSSFDSRYFGPVTKVQLIGTYRGVLTW